LTASQAARASALRYRDAELPFILTGVPDHEDAVDAWTVEYLRAAIPAQRSAEVSQTGAFMYWSRAGAGKAGSPGSKYPDWKPPTT
jgi:hypothetical protein